MLFCFDYDGVMVDSLLQLLRIARSAQEKMGAGRPPTEQDFRNIDELNFLTLAQKAEMPESHIPRYAKTMSLMLHQDTGPLKMIPGISAVIRELSLNHSLCIITANTRSVVEMNLKRNALHEVVCDIYDGNEEGTKAEKIKRAADRFSTPFADTFMIGDTRSDIRHGRAAGARSVAVTWGYQSRKSLELENPDFFVERPSDLLLLTGQVL